MGIVTFTELGTDLLPHAVGCRTLVPDDVQNTLPLLVLLHGGSGSSDYLETVRPQIESAWDDGSLPQLAVATLDAERSQYLDYHDGTQRWETFITTEWLAHLRATLPVATTREGTLIAGISMGGHGALRLALRRPEMFLAVAAMEPAIMPALLLTDVPERNLLFQRDMIETWYGSPPDDHWNSNNPAALAIANAERIRQAGLEIYLEVGTDDFFLLDDGAEFLHRVLLDHRIRHEYRLVLGANHVGRSVAPRFSDMLGFVGRALTAPVPDPDLEGVLALLETTGMLSPRSERNSSG